MKKVYIILFFLFFVIGKNIAQEEPTAAPQIKTFSTNPDQLGALANSVNLFSGDVALPLNLVSLPGRNGLDVNISISYSSSGISKSVGTWNLEAPTGILGLGWSMDYPKIIVDNKNTGARDDDEFYLVEGGSTNRLVRTGGDNSSKVYETKNYQFWKVYYYPTTEKWEITKENGVNYIYGDNTSNRSTVQYIIKWGNWIGSSSLISGQQRQAMIWNLSEVKDTWGNYVKYEYESVEKTVGNGTTGGSLSHTAASYLKKITDTFERKIEFFYGNKRSNEYIEPHTEVNEPDAYQERFETKYLDSIKINTKNNDLISKTIFGYNSSNFVDTGTNKEKRLLETITQENRNKQSLPNFKFTYLTSVNKGALSTVVNPTGGVVTYNYTLQTISNSNLDIQIEAPEVGYSKPLIWNADNYVIITWRNGNTIKICVYEWDGQWKGGVIQTITDVPENDNKQWVKVSMQEDYFALIHDKFTSILGGYSKSTKLYLFRKDETKSGEWISVNKSYSHVSNTKSETQLNTGKTYSAIVLDGGTSSVVGYELSDDEWIEKTFYTASSGDKNRFLYIGGIENYLWIHNRNSATDLIYFQFWNELNEWDNSKYFNTGQDASEYNYWYANNSYILGMLGSDDERIYVWDENYNNFGFTSIGGNIDDTSPIYFFANNNFCLLDNQYYPRPALTYRYNGANWLNQYIPYPIYATSSHFSFANDYVLMKNGTTNNASYAWKKYEFSPNSLTWNNAVLSSTLSNPKSFAGNDFFIFGDKIFYKNPSGFQQLTSVPSLTCTDSKFFGGLKYFKFEHWTGTCSSSSYSDSRLHIFKNGQIYNFTPITASRSEKNDLCQVNSFVTHNSDELEDSWIIKIHRVLNDKASGNQTMFAVSSIDVNDGYETKYTSYNYFPSYGTIDPSGTVAKYNKVRVRPGTNNSSETIHPFGYTDTYFFNGLIPTSHAKSIPEDEYDNTNAATNYKLLTSLPYLVEKYENGDDVNPISKKENYWYVYSKNINSEMGYYTRIKKTIEIQDVTLETFFTYDVTSGLLKSKYFDNYGSNGVESIFEIYKYGSEVYSELENLNILSPVIQTKTFTNSTCTSVSATTWTNSLQNKWAPHKTYIYTIAGDVDFTNWTSGSPNTNWLKTSEIIARDSWGNVLESVDVDNIRSVTKYGFNSTTPIAVISNSTNAESKIELCQEYRTITTGDLSLNFDDYQYGSTGTISYAMVDETVRGKVQKVTVISVPGSGGVLINMGALNNFSNYIIELDIKLGSGEVELLSSTSGTGEINLGYFSNTDWTHRCFIWNTGTNGANSKIFIRSKWNSAGSSATFYIDNVRIYPQDAFVTSTNLDPIYLDPICVTNANGVNTFSEYDYFRRPTNIRNNEGVILSTTSYFLSRESYTNFNTTFPNYTRIVTPAISGESRSYTDGFGKTRQVISKESATQILVIENLFDELGRNYIQTKPTKINSSNLSYRSGFVNPNVLQTNETLLGEVQTTNGDSYSYSRTKYDSSPLSRVIETGSPGSNFRIGSTHTPTFYYLTNSSEFSGFSSGQYFITKSIDANGTNGSTTYLMKDRLGNVIAEKSGPVDIYNQSNVYPQTTYKYDVYGNLINIYPPNYYNTPPGMTASDYVQTMTYDYLGRLKTKYSKDAGTVNYIYDKVGRTRFMMDANGEDITTHFDNVLYWKYDDLGRIIEEGYFAIEWGDGSALQTNAENSSYPTTPSTWRKKYTYGDISNQYNYGKLVKVEVNNDASSDTEVEETYNYNIDGQVKDKGIKIVDYNNIEKTISYEYDILGNVTRVSYMPIDLSVENKTITSAAYYEAADELSVGNNFAVNSGGSLTLKAGTAIKLLPGFSVNVGGTLTTILGGAGSADPEETQIIYAYDEMGRTKKIGTTSDDDFFAAYNYGTNGELKEEKLHNNGVTRLYTYENPGWLTSIKDYRSANDSIFVEQLKYTSGGYNGAGYFNGNIAKAEYRFKWNSSLNYNILYKYDKLNRLLVADNTFTSSNYDVGVGNEITYDANGNIKDLTTSGVTRNYAYYIGTNKVQNIDGSGNDYSYDGNGNVSNSVNKGISSISYDPFINLTKQINNGDVTNLTYGSGNQRVIKSDNYITTAYIHGMSNFPLMEKIDEGSTEVTKLYVYGPTGLIAVNDDEGWFFLIKDHLGSTRVVLNEANQKVSNYNYMPFGNTFNNSTGTEVTYQFTGQEYDTELSLHNFRARLYDGDLGMFYGVDPAGQGFSPYGFCGNNPIIYVDKDGRWFLLDDIASFVIGGTINLLSNLGNIDNFGEGFAAFSAGGIQGIATIYGGPVGYYTSAALVGATNSAIGQMHNWSDFGNVNWGQAGINAGASVAGAFVGAQFAPIGSKIGNWTAEALNISSPVISNAISQGVSGAVGGGLTGFTLGYAFSGGNMDKAMKAGVDGIKSGFAIGSINGAISGYRYADDNNISPWTGEKTHGHHSNPKFMGGDKNQQLTDISGSRHLKLHSEMNEYLRNQTNEFGQHMQPMSGNSGINIRQNFSSFQLRSALDGFYLRNLYKYPRTALDYFLYTRK
ncbi:MAG: RHS repeat-associated core domain-containing protein [Melioribacteraceae bacterium]